jgi:hypothetical protein
MPRVRIVQQDRPAHSDQVTAITDNNLQNLSACDAVVFGPNPLPESILSRENAGDYHALHGAPQNW